MSSCSFSSSQSIVSHYGLNMHNLKRFWACFGWRSCWFTKSEVDIRINLAISAAFIAWIFIAHNAEWKLVQFFLTSNRL
ncbi:hypothetical protein HanRHA438_Chr17g0801931 [Helianthus annuus]|nr:hypothetical protein HanXRQr2_Chr17g0791621 [Helianthus annuus]KAJ0428373.1 hypothetical protein HanHA300_Chr17g0645391 [Helianthus annuus]KAJ0446693.1 hypothetical protein HanHA89_Chr17g0697081 [Helianthus annuus]KAJ0629807.1 hypothetical protein HanIR_Chr00c05g0905311 [Helianthus annuus]KAJ0631600.1 hypothetical protein HanLR1_Chr17g0655731 [Helianthus annuus]